MRTEEDKIVQAGIKVILGGKEYSIPPLVIRHSREWRKKVVTLVSPLAGLVSVTTDTADEFSAALNTLLVTMPDKVIDLFFEYARELNRDQIELEATETELSTAFMEVLALAFPLAQSSLNVVSRLYGQTNTFQ